MTNPLDAIKDASLAKLKTMENSRRPDWRVVYMILVLVVSHAIISTLTGGWYWNVGMLLAYFGCYYLLADISNDLRRGALMGETVAGVMKILAEQSTAKTKTMPTIKSTNVAPPTTPPKFPFPKPGNSGTTFEGFPE